VKRVNEDKLDYFMNLSYPITVVKEETGYSVAILDLPGCLSQGDTLEEALKNIEDAKAGWLEIAIEQGREIPEPEHERSFSGRFLVRVPKGLHKTLAIQAKRSGVSLNQYVTHLLTAAAKEEEYGEVTKEILRAVEALNTSGLARITFPSSRPAGLYTVFPGDKGKNEMPGAVADNYALAS
jgi:antitoxin HicB